MEAGYHLTRVDGCPLLFVFLVSIENSRVTESPPLSASAHLACVISTFYRPLRPTSPLRRAAMALSKLSGDEQGVVFTQLCNVLEVDPRASPCA